MRRAIEAALLAIAFVASGCIAGSAAPADDETEAETIAGGPWPAGPYVPCAPGIVTFVGPRLEEPPGTPPAERFSSGVGVEIAIPSKPRFLNGQAFPTARVVHYQGDAGNALMASEKRGDRVQVCFVAFPHPLRDAKTKATICDPATDLRGMTYRIYDYAKHAAYAGPDSQHSCGGA